MNPSLLSKLKPEFQTGYQSRQFPDDIPVLLNDRFLTGDNQKYMKMYDWMSRGYDFVETVVGKIKYGNSINNMRREMMSRLDWRDQAFVLYVSIGTGKDLEFIPQSINSQTLELAGVDISLGMLKQCRKKFKNKLNLSLVNCCAEDLPFADETFDVVFHVGGINFFNDKPLAIREMIRVAKKGTKILIADETADYIETQYKKSNLSKKYFEGQTVDLNDIASGIPASMSEVTTELLWGNKFYCITFRK